MNQSDNSSSGAQAQTDPYVVVRLLVLAFLVLMVNLWCLHHFADKLVGLVLSNGPFAFMGIYGFFSKVLKSEEEKKVKEGLRSLMLIFLKPSVLAGLYLFFIIFGSVVSSVTVMAGGESVQGIKIQLVPEGEISTNAYPEKTLSGSAGMVRFFVLTTPFGRPFYLRADGYQRRSLDLYPWVGKRLRIAEDFQPSPSVLLRVPPLLIRSTGVGFIKVFADDQLVHEGKTSAGNGSILLGPKKTLPTGLAQSWQLQLMSLNVQGATMAVCLDKWQNFSHETPSTYFQPGMSLRAEYYGGDGTLAAVGHTTITSDKLQDLMMRIKGE